MVASEWLILRANRAGSAGEEESEVKLGVALVDGLGFAAGEEPEHGAGAGWILAFQSFKGPHEAIQALFHLHRRGAKRSIIDSGDAGARIHWTVKKFILLKPHEEAHDPRRLDGTWG